MGRRQDGHACAVWAATAGQQGMDLGADEQPLVLLAFVVIELSTNKIICIEQYVIRPPEGEVTDQSGGASIATIPLLSQELQQASALTDELVRRAGQPLPAVIAQFDKKLRTLKLEPDSTNFRLVTDGQLPFRQCLHPQACARSLPLPGYYSRFHDLHKEFQILYSNPLTTPTIALTDILEHLTIPKYEGNDFYMKEAKEMADVIQKMISDGFQFGFPETVDMVLEPGICSKDDEIDGNCVVRARGLPWQSSDQDIAKFFRGLNVAKGGVALCLSQQGRRNGEALVRFVSMEHRDMALKRHKHHIGNRYIEVYKATGEDFLGVAGGATNEAAAFLSRGAQVIVRMRGLPYDCTPPQVLEFFSTGANPCSVLDGAEGVLFVKRADGRATGDAFVLFPREEDAPKALAKHRELIGTRYIELFRSTTAEVQQVLNRSLDPKTYEAPQPIMPQVALLPQHVITSGTLKDCIRLRGLPYEAQVEHILKFLDDFAKNIVFQGVHMVYNAQGQPSGEAFIQMDSEASAFLSAQQKHHRYMSFGTKQRYIEVFQCSGEDMNLVLTGGIASPSAGGKALSPGRLPPSSPPLPALVPLPPPPQVNLAPPPLPLPPPPSSRVSPYHHAQPPSQGQLQAAAQAQILAQQALQRELLMQYLPSAYPPFLAAPPAAAPPMHQYANPYQFSPHHQLAQQPKQMLQHSMQSYLSNAYLFLTPRYGMPPGGPQLSPQLGLPPPSPAQHHQAVLNAATQHHLSQQHLSQQLAGVQQQAAAAAAVKRSYEHAFASAAAAEGHAAKKQYTGFHPGQAAPPSLHLQPSPFQYFSGV